MTLILHIKPTSCWIPTGMTGYTSKPKYISSAAVCVCVCARACFECMAAKKKSPVYDWHIILRFIPNLTSPSPLSLCVASTNGEIRFIEAKPYGVYIWVSSHPVTTGLPMFYVTRIEFFLQLTILSFSGDLFRTRVSIFPHYTSTRIGTRAM